MDNIETFIKKLLEIGGFSDYKLSIEDEKRGILFIHDNPNLIKENLPSIVQGLNHIVQLYAKKIEAPPIFFDVNNYRRERENLIIELAKAAARKVVATKEEIQLPSMNSYERRIVHTELATHPDIKTESIGAGKERSVIVKLISDEKPPEEKK